MNLIQIDVLGWLSDEVKRQLFDSMVELVSDQAKKILGNEASDIIKKLKSDASFQAAFDEGIKQATQRFAQEYFSQDSDLVTAIVSDKDFWGIASVRKALLHMIQRPGRFLEDDREKVLVHFDDVLPEYFDRGQLDQAVTFFLRCLAEELWHLPQLQPIYELQLQRITADRATEMVYELKGMRADVQQTIVAMLQGITEQQKLLTATARLSFSEPPKLRHNLPQPDYVHFVGRTEELLRLQELLSPKNRSWVIVIDGIGGIGKSALALESAHYYLQEFDKLSEEERFQAIIWTSAKTTSLTQSGIAPRQQVTRTLSDIYTTISIALEREDITRASEGKQDELVCHALTRHRTLLIIDNLETIDDEQVNAFLRELPAPTKCIVTTRHRVDIAYPIRLMGMPAQDAIHLITNECEKKGITLTSKEIDLLYRRTGGVPLAIVWSIAQMGYGYSVETVLRRLGQPNEDISRFCFEGTIERIRDTDAYRLLVALSLFATDASREALADVAGFSDDVLSRDEGLVELEKLSLVNRQKGRLSLLPLTKEYIRLSTAFGQDFRSRQINFYLDFCHRYGGTTEKWEHYAEVELEKQNLLDVMEWCYQERRWQSVIDFQYMLWGYWELRGYWTEQLIWCSRALEAHSQLATQSLLSDSEKQKQGTFYLALCWILFNQGDLEVARAHAHQAIKILDPIGDQHGLATAYRHLGVIASSLGQFEDAKELHRIALEKWEALGDRREISSIYNNLGVVYTIEGNFKEARHVLEHALSIRQELGDIVRIGSTLAGLGDLDELEGDWAGAEKYYTECLEAARLVGDKRNMGLSLLDLARIAQKQNNLQQANQLASVARRVLLSIGAVKSIAESDEIIRQTQTVMTNVNLMKDTV